MNNIKLIQLRSLLVRCFSKKIIGLYDINSMDNIYSTILDFYCKFYTILFFLVRFIFPNLIYIEDGIIYCNSYMKKNHIYPIISNVILVSNNNNIDITDIIKKYHFSVPLKLIVINEGFIGDHFIFSYYSFGKKKFIIKLNEVMNKNISLWSNFQ